MCLCACIDLTRESVFCELNQTIVLPLCDCDIFFWRSALHKLTVYFTPQLKMVSNF